jgi:GT2 family glycosyltransferase
MIGRTDMTTLSGWRAASSRSGALDDCCLVIPTYSRHVEIVRLLDALIALADVPAEVVVVDGHPSRELGRILREWSAANPAPFELIYVESPPGLTRQRNIGVDISTREYVFLLDDDAVPLPGYFSETRRVFEADHERRVGGIAGCVINEMERPVARRWQLRFALGLVPRLDPMIYHPSGTHTPRSLLKPFSGVRRIDVMPGCAWTFRREVFETERFSTFFQGYSQGEDLEMSLRVGRSWTILCCGDARILHLPGAHGRPVSYTRGRMEMRNRHFVWKRHSPTAAPRHVAAFWLDTFLLVAMDVAWFCVRPWKVQPLGHALGTIREMATCLAGPPRFEEPPACREYRLDAAGVPAREFAARRAE